MITQEQVESALTYLAESAKDYAEAKGLRVWLEEKRKVVKATVFSASPQGTVAEREAWAYQQTEYTKLIEDLRGAVVAEETLRAYRGAAEARIEVWRSQEATRRSANV